MDTTAQLGRIIVKVNLLWPSSGLEELEIGGLQLVVVGPDLLPELADARIGLVHVRIHLEAGHRAEAGPALHIVVSRAIVRVRDVLSEQQ